MEIDYYSFGRDGHSTRVVQPWRVFNASGQWYLSGWCERAEGERLFRVDRISRAEPLAATFDPPAPSIPAVAARPSCITPVRTTPWWCWTWSRRPTGWPSSIPTKAVQMVPPTVLRVALRTSQPAWLERLLLRAGPYARVVDGDDTVRVAAAARILHRYRP